MTPDVPLGLARFGALGTALDVDLTRPVSPDLVTEVLACCACSAEGIAVDRAVLWALGVGRRIECLLGIVALEGTRALAVTLACGTPGCGQPIEAELPIDELLAVARAAGGEALVVEHDGTRLVLRRPTGADQRAWRRRVFADEASARRAIVETLAVEMPDGALTTELLERIDGCLDAHDPLVGFRLDAECPDCHGLTTTDVDLAGVAIRRLRHVQADLFTAVHVLAGRYHWSERAVLDLPAWRRARYLALAERGA